MSSQPQSSERTPRDGNGPASAPYWEEPASSPYWDAPELAAHLAGQSVHSPESGASPAILQGLTDEQQFAVQDTEGPLIIVGTPGSGKTLVIVRRIAHLVRDLNVTPWRIMAATFTNKAAREMRARVEEFLPDDGKDVTIGTFHSVCARILRRHGEHVGINRNFTIYDQDDQIVAIKSAMQLAEVDAKRFPPRAILSRISAAKSTLQESSQMRESAYAAEDEYGAHWIETCSRVYHYYEEALSRQNALDFDDLLLRAVQLLENVPEVREQYHDRYRYLMIDEFQDTNVPQYRLARLITGSHNNLCVVGDPDQSIYSWRGANLQNYDEFRESFPNVKIFHLTFRCGQNILDAAHTVIDGSNPEPEDNSNSTDKEHQNSKSLWREIIEWLWGQSDSHASPAPVRPLDPPTDIDPKRSVPTDGNSELVTDADSSVGDRPSRPRLIAHSSISDRGFVGLMETSNAEEEAAWAVNEVIRLARSGEYNRGDCAIMYRTNAQSRAFEEQCLRLGIPYRLVGGVRFYHRKEIQDTLCYLRVIYNAGDEVSLLRVINTPARGIGAKTVQQLNRYAGERGITMLTAMQQVAEARTEQQPCPLGVTARAAKSIADLAVTFQRLTAAARELPVADLLDRVLDMSGLARAVQADEDGDGRWDNLQELRGLAEDYGPSPEADGLGAFLERVSLVSDVDSYEQSDDAVTLITLHQTKGLEFPVAIMTGIEEGLLPHLRSMGSGDEIDEERRLCYVGMTRAKKRLYMSFAYYRRYGTALPSRFVYDLPNTVRAGTSLEGGHQSRSQFSRQDTRRPGRNEDAVIGGSWATSRRESRVRRGEAGDGTAGGPTRGRLRGDIDEKLTEWVSSRPTQAPQPERIPLTVGEIVRHSVFGEGVVQDVQGVGDEEQVTVNFSSVGLKRLLVSLARLERG